MYKLIISSLDPKHQIAYLKDVIVAGLVLPHLVSQLSAHSATGESSISQVGESLAKSDVEFECI